MSRTPWWTTLTSDELLRLRDRVLKVLKRRFGSSLGTDIEDVVQQAFVKLFRDRNAIDPHADGLYRYLRTTAKNEALDRLKGTKTRETQLRTLQERIVPSKSPVDQLESREKKEAVRQFFCELGDVDRLILWSYVVEGRSIQSIARQLDLSWHRVDDTIEWLIQRMRRRLLE